MSVYCVDSDSMIELADRYPRRTFRGLWASMETLCTAGSLRSSDEVLAELRKKDDDLYRWARERKELWVPSDASIQQRVTEVVGRFKNWVNPLTGKNRADPFVLAVALQLGASVVTQENPTGRPGGPKLPDVCQAYGLRAMKLLDMITEQRWTF